MKKIRNIMIVLAMCTPFLGCEDDLKFGINCLEKAPRSDANMNTVFKSVDSSKTYIW